MKLHCYHCGDSLETLSLPLARLDTCPGCGRYLHACRMCRHFDTSETSKQCREDDAEKVHDKSAANFCDFFEPSPDAHEGSALRAEQRARGQLAALFGEADGGAPTRSVDEDALQDAEALFRK